MGTQHESWVERRIREAQERGDFDNLPGAGKPLEALGDPDDENWWVRRLIEREQLDTSVALPPQLALRKEAQVLPERVLRERTEQGVRDLVEDFNARVRECWLRPLEGPLVVARMVDEEELVARWRTHRAAQQAARRATTPPAPPAQPPRGRWHRLRRAFGHLRGRA